MNDKNKSEKKADAVEYPTEGGVYIRDADTGKLVRDDAGKLVRHESDVVPAEPQKDAAPAAGNKGAAANKPKSPFPTDGSAQ